MKKIVFILLLVFCLTGCDNSIELDITEDIKTKVSLSFTLDEYKARLGEKNLDDAEVKNRIQSMIDFRNAFTEPYSDLFEEKNFVNNGNYYEGVYEYTYTYSNFSDNSVLNNCFEYFEVKEDDNRIYIFATGKSKCAPFKLMVKTEDRMVSSNESAKDGNVYIWNVQESNNDIDMTISKSAINKPNITKPKEESFSFNVVEIICCIVALIIGIVAFIFNKKFKESD